MRRSTFPTLVSGICLLLLSSISNVSAQELSAETFEMLLDKSWKGELEYLDYETSTDIEIPVELTVEKINNRTFSFNYSYPEEPSANSTTRVEIGKNGEKLNEEEVVNITELPDGAIEIFTRVKGKDAGEACVFTYAYEISDDRFAITKRVNYEGEYTQFVRSRFKFKAD